MASHKKLLKAMTGLSWLGWHRKAPSVATMLTPFLRPFGIVAPARKVSKPLASRKPRVPARTSTIATNFSKPAPAGGRFIDGVFTNANGRRAYKIFIPGGVRSTPLPLIVMLHGCQQSADDFALGTHMNRLAQKRPCLVLYPIQTPAANRQNCWNWYKKTNQMRGRGEPSLIAGMTRDIIARHAADPSRVYIAGLSAGGAMAATMGALYPDLYAAVGIHSGLPYAAASDLHTALSAMRRGAAEPEVAASPLQAAAALIPTILFHGDGDFTVHPRNADRIMAQHLARAGLEKNDKPLPQTIVKQGTKRHGHSYTRTTQQNHHGQTMAELWLIHGAGHAWSGGTKGGTFTDPKGPDASAAMMRFFARHALGSSRQTGAAISRTSP